MADEDLVHKVRQLGDVDLAALLCLTSREHCIISTDRQHLDGLTAELQLVASRTFGLKSAVINCTPETTLNDLVTAIQLPQPRPKLTVPRTPSPLHVRSPDLDQGAQHGDASGSTHAYSQGHAFTHSQSQHQHQQQQLRSNNLQPVSSLSPNTAASSSRAASPTHAQQQQQQQIANVILARDLDLAPKAVQIQCLELMRTRRIFTRTAVQACPKQFLLIAVLGAESAGQARLTRHLNDHFYIAHWHDPEDGFGHLEDEEGEEGEGHAIDEIYRDEYGHGDGNEEGRDTDTASLASAASVVRRTRTPKPPSTPTPGSGQISRTDWAPGIPLSPSKPDMTPPPPVPQHFNPLFTETDISTLSTLSLRAHVDIEIERYQMNIIAFLRLHRAVTPGSVPPAATTHFRTLIRSLAALHGLDFATPELVQLAARKIYAHRIVIVAPERERSMQWGSDLAAVKTLLDDVQPEDVIEDVLGMVDVPL